MRPVIAIDSDTKNMGLAYYDGSIVIATHAPGEGLNSMAIGMENALTYLTHQISSRASKWALLEPPIIVVERPMIWSGKHGAKHESILLLATYAGVALGICAVVFPSSELHAVTPAQWKGQRVKNVHQRSVCEKLGWDYEERAGYVVPSARRSQTPLFVPEGTNKGMYKHIMDAVGIAYWANQTSSF